MATHPFDFDRYIVPNYGLRLVKNTLYGNLANKTPYLTIRGSSGYNSAATIQALRNAVDALSSGVYVALLNSGDVSMLHIMKADANYAIILRYSYGTGTEVPANASSMGKYGGVWGNWVQLSLA